MRVRHPYALEDGPPDADGRVHYGGRRETARVDDDGVFTVPDSARGRLTSWAAGYGYELEELVVDEDDADQEGGETQSGDTESEDGRDADAMIHHGVCPWCDDYEGDHVGQHASSAHPNEWNTYTT